MDYRKAHNGDEALNKDHELFEGGRKDQPIRPQDAEVPEDPEDLEDREQGKLASQLPAEETPSQPASAGGSLGSHEGSGPGLRGSLAAPSGSETVGDAHRYDPPDVRTGFGNGGRDLSLGADTDAVLRVGELLLSAGTDAYRIIRAMKRTARSLGFDSFDASIGLTSIRFTAHRGNKFRTAICTIKQPGVDATLIEMVEDFTHHLPKEVTPEWVNRNLDYIEKKRGARWRPSVLAVAAGVACAAFAVLNHFGVISAVVVGLSAFFGQRIRVLFLRRQINQIGATVFSGAAACLIYFLGIKIPAATSLVDSVDSLESGYVASVLFLIPGFPLFTSMLDLSRFDINAGWERLVYACGLIISATTAVWVVSSFTGLVPGVPPQPAQSQWLWLLIAWAASFCGIAGFAFLFNSSRRMALVAAVLGSAANVIKFVLLYLGISVQFSCFIGGICVGLVASVIGSQARIPRITITIPASVIMIPGTAMFRAMYYLNLGDINQALTDCVTSTLQIFAIAAGLVTARLITDRDWATNSHIDFTRHPDHSKEVHPHGKNWA